MEITWVSTLMPELQEMVGRYQADSMYLRQAANSDEEPKFVFYDENSGGWSLSKFNSSCTDDVCMFGYQPKTVPGRITSGPPGKGYTFGGQNLHLYYQQLIFDDADLDPKARRGYFESVSYNRDPQSGTPDLSEFNGRYALQPRYTHSANGKFAVFPIDLKGVGRKWVVAGHIGLPRKWHVLATALDPTGRRYFAPNTTWDPPIFQIRNSCANHLLDATCFQLSTTCQAHGQDTTWVQKCCRHTCDRCDLSRTSCVLPKSNPLVAAALDRTVQHGVVNISSGQPRFRGSAHAQAIRRH